MGGLKNCQLTRTIKELSQFDNKKPEELGSEFDHFHAANAHLTSPFKGRNIVDLDFVHKQLLDRHKPCNTTLKLTQYQRERLICLTSILYLSLQNYSTVTMVKTSIYDVDAKCAADTYWVYLRVRIILCKLILFLSELDIYWVETRNKMIIWKHSSSDSNIKSKFVSVVISPRKWWYIFIIKRYCLYIIDHCVVYKTLK